MEKKWSKNVIEFPQQNKSSAYIFHVFYRKLKRKYFDEGADGWRCHSLMRMVLN